ncbi:MAG: transcriptional regulator with XRE-family HTH domain [Halioglobus sp.]|jgi:transcriptional regulator with XRE-family HTH domain
MNDLDKIATKKRLNWADDFEEADNNIEWRVRSAIISARVLLFLKRKESMDRAALAEKMDVSVQYLSKLLKGKENMTLKTITRLESYTGLDLINVIGENQNTNNVKSVHGGHHRVDVEKQTLPVIHRPMQASKAKVINIRIESKSVTTSSESKVG